jgi:putative transposase
MGQKLGKKALEEVATIAQPDTILAWHRTLTAQTCDRAPPRKSVGRPRMDQELEALVARMARENRSWGYDRIVGAVANLGYCISDQMVGNILKRHAIPPRKVEKLGCLYPIEVSQVGCILDRGMVSSPPT